MKNEEWRMKNGEWRMENGEWRMGNGEWGMDNEEWGMGIACFGLYRVLGVGGVSRKKLGWVCWVEAVCCGAGKGLD